MFENFFALETKVRNSKSKVFRQRLFPILLNCLIILANAFTCEPEHRGCANQDSAVMDARFQWDDVFPIDEKSVTEQCWERCKENEALGCTGFMSHFFGKCYLVKEYCQVFKPNCH